MKPLLAVLVCVAGFGLLPHHTDAQVLFTYQFDDVTTTSGTSSAGTTTASLTFSSFTANSDDTNSGSTGVMSFSGWPLGATDISDSFTGSLSTSAYYQFTISANPGNEFSLTSISFTAGRSGTGVRQFAVRSSVDGYTDNLSASASDSNVSIVGSNTFQFDDTASLNPGNSITLTNGSFSAINSSVTFRIYGFNAEASGGTFRLDNVAISGSASAIPEPSTYAAMAGAAALAGAFWRRRRSRISARP